MQQHPGIGLLKPERVTHLLRRAALDVTDPEPLPPDHLLWALPKVLITPHMAGDSPEATIRTYELAGDQIRRFAAGEALINEVDHYLLE